MVCRRFFRVLPHRLHVDFEVLERAGPGFHRVPGDARIPVQFVDGEVAMLNGWQDSGEHGILHMRVRPEFQPVETHRHAPGYLAAESCGKKIRQLQPAIVNSIVAAAG